MAFLWGGVYREGGNTTDPKSKQFFDLNPPIHKPIHLSPPFIFQTLADYCLVHVTENIEYLSNLLTCGKIIKQV